MKAGDPGSQAVYPLASKYSGYRRSENSMHRALAVPASGRRRLLSYFRFCKSINPSCFSAVAPFRDETSECNGLLLSTAQAFIAAATWSASPVYRPTFYHHLFQFLESFYRQILTHFLYGKYITSENFRYPSPFAGTSKGFWWASSSNAENLIFAIQSIKINFYITPLFSGAKIENNTIFLHTPLKITHKHFNYWKSTIKLRNGSSVRWSQNRIYLVYKV